MLEVGPKLLLTARLKAIEGQGHHSVGGRICLSNVLHAQSSGRHDGGMNRMSAKLIIETGAPSKGKGTLIIIPGQEV